jgi:hypothetical protein
MGFIPQLNMWPSTDKEGLTQIVLCIIKYLEEAYLRILLHLCHHMP